MTLSYASHTSFPYVRCDSLHSSPCRGSWHDPPHQPISRVFCLRAGVDMRDASWIIHLLTNLWCSLAEWFGSNGPNWVWYEPVHSHCHLSVRGTIHSRTLISCYALQPINRRCTAHSSFSLQFRRSLEAGALSRTLLSFKWTWFSTKDPGLAA